MISLSQSTRGSPPLRPRGRTQELHHNAGKVHVTSPRGISDQGPQDGHRSSSTTTRLSLSWSGISVHHLSVRSPFLCLPCSERRFVLSCTMLGCLFNHSCCHPTKLATGSCSTAASGQLDGREARIRWILSRRLGLDGGYRFDVFSCDLLRCDPWGWGEVRSS